jgi:hypothetical protein
MSTAHQNNHLLWYRGVFVVFGVPRYPKNTKNTKNTLNFLLIEMILLKCEQRVFDFVAHPVQVG